MWLADYGSLPVGVAGFVVACLLSAVLTGLVLRIARAIGARQIVRDDGPQAHLKKQGTPSLGGIGIIAAFVITTGGIMLIAPYAVDRAPALWVLGTCLAFAAIGFYDDYCKFALGRKEGWKARYRIVGQVLVGGAFAYFALYQNIPPTGGIPGIQFSLLGLGPVGWTITSALVLMGSVNGVNFSDGLDGLAGGLTTICAGCLSVLLFWTGQDALGTVALCLAGASLGFLWHNSHPASIFMGDVGSYGLGAALGAVALLGHVELAFAVVGFIFVAEALSVMLQVASFRATGKRIFKMAPLHHHFEMCGWPETKVVARFYIVGFLLGVIGLAWVASTS